VQFVVNTFGASIRKVGECLVVRAGGRGQAVSAHKVTALVIATGAVPSTDAIQLAVANNVDIVFLDKYGDPDGRVWQPRLGSTTAVRRRQLEAAAGPDGLAFARGWVDAKLRHQAEFLADLARRRAGSAAAFGPALDAVAACRVTVRWRSGRLAECGGLRPPAYS